MKYKYIISDSVDPYENLALEQSLFRAACEDSIILYLWQNDNTIVIGRNQAVSVECRADEFRAKGGRIARRRSGGGAVYHDLGNLNFSILCKTDAAKQADYRFLLVGTLRDFGVRAEANERNDLLADGRKFSGSAVYDDGAVLCQHGTILIGADIGKMTYYLTPDRSKLDRNHVDSVASRVTNLSVLSPEITVKKLQEALIRTAKAAPLLYCPDADELRRQAEFFGSDRWIFEGKE